jgi:hypothetical protein
MAPPMRGGSTISEVGDTSGNTNVFGNYEESGDENEEDKEGKRDDSEDTGLRMRSLTVQSNDASDNEVDTV